MNSINKRVVIILLSIWHCAVSFISPWWLAFTLACFADVHNDEYDISVMIGCFMVIIWSVVFIPSFVSLLTKLKKVKRGLVFLPFCAFFVFGLIGFVVLVLPYLY